MLTRKKNYVKPLTECRNPSSFLADDKDEEELLCFFVMIDDFASREELSSLLSKREQH